jgi:hypothetical protein
MADVTYYTHNVSIYEIEKCGEHKPTWANESTDVSWYSTENYGETGTFRPTPSSYYDIDTDSFSAFSTDTKGQCFKVVINSVTSTTRSDLDGPPEGDSNPWPRYTWEDDQGTVHMYGEVQLSSYDPDDGFSETTGDGGDISVWDCCPRKKYIDITTGKCATFMKTSDHFTGGDDVNECESHGDPVETELEPRCVPDCPGQMRGLSGYSWTCGPTNAMLESLSNQTNVGEHYDENSYVPAVKYGGTYVDLDCCWPATGCETKGPKMTLGESTDDQSAIEHELDPLGVGCGEDVLYPIPSHSGTEEVTLADFVLGLPDAQLASSMPICQFSPPPSSSETEDLCGEVIMCSGPPPPPPSSSHTEDCYDPCYPRGTEDMDPCPEVDTDNLDPCKCPKESAGFASAGCDPHICTFFNETYEM